MQNKNKSQDHIELLAKTDNKIFNNFYRIFLTVLILFSALNYNIYSQPLAANKTKFVGNVVGYSGIRSDFLKYWNQVTPENAGKWGSVEGTPGNYNWTALDNIYNFAKTNNIPFKQHTLVWGSQYPSFVATMDSATLNKEIETWIKLNGEKYPKMDLVDVVNEPLHSFTGNALNIIKALGGGGSTGWDWVVKAFEMARKYLSPSTKLLINEYNILNDATAANNYVKIINILKAKGLIDGIGVQAHGFEVEGPAVTTLKSNLKKLTATGIPVYITEFDINIANDDAQLQKYQSVFPALYEDPGVAGITLWGYVYNYIWRADAYLINSRGGERPALQWLRNYLVAPFRPVVISPFETINESLTPKLKWHASATATSYRLQLSTSRTFDTIVIDTTTTDTTFSPKKLSWNTVYFWRVDAKNDKGEGDFCEATFFSTVANPVSVDNEQVPSEYQLYQNYPNPFNPTTVITYRLKSSGNVTLKIYDMLGREVHSAVNEYQTAGIHKVDFNIQSTGLSSGIYYYRLTSGSFSETRKMIYMK